MITAVEDLKGAGLATDVLRTAEMYDVGNKGKQEEFQKKKSITRFKREFSRAFQVLELRAQQRYFEAVQQESNTRQLLIRRQSSILHQYGTQLRAFLDDQLKIVRKLSKKKDAYKVRLEGCLGFGIFF